MARKGTSKFEPQIADPDGVSIDAVTGQPMAIPLDEDQMDIEAPPMEDSGVPTQVAEDAVSDQGPLQGLDALRAAVTPQLGKTLLEKTNPQASQQVINSIARQEQGLNQNELALKNLEDKGGGPNLMPLYQISDRLTGEDSSKYYKQPESPQELAQKLYGLKDLLQKEKQGLTQEQINLLKAYGPMQQFQNRLDLADRQRLFRAQNSIVENIKKNPLDAKLAQQMGNITNVLTSMSTGKITPQNFQEMQQTARSNLGIKGSSGVGERTETYLDSLGLRGSKLEQFLTATPEDIRKNGGQEYINHMQGILEQELKSAQLQREKLVNKLTLGWGNIIDKPGNEDVKKAIQELVDASTTQTNSQPLPQISKMTGNQQINPKTKKVEPTRFSNSGKSTNPLSYEEWVKAGKPKAGQ